MQSEIYKLDFKEENEETEKKYQLLFLLECILQKGIFTLSVKIVHYQYSLGLYHPEKQCLRQKLQIFLTRTKYYEILKGNTECFSNKHINNLQMCCHIQGNNLKYTSP